MSDADHVVCSLQQAQEYLNSLSSIAIVQHSGDRLYSQPPSVISSVAVPLDESSGAVFSQVTMSLAKPFEAPIALIHIKGEGNDHWQAQCGLPEDERSTASSLRNSNLFAMAFPKDGIVVPDTAEDVRFSQDPVLLEKGIRFFAGMPVFGPDEEEIGSLCVFDTRCRQIAPQQEDTLKALARAVTTAIALQRGVTDEAEA